MAECWDPQMAGLPRMQETEQKMERGMERWEQWVDWSREPAGMKEWMLGRAGYH